MTVNYTGRNSTAYGPSTTAPTGAGDYTAAATFGGDSNHNGGGDSKPYSIAKAGQTINFGTLGGKTFGDADFTLSATASSGLGVSFAASGQCGVTGLTVHLTGAGSCTITASQGGDSNFDAAQDVPQSFQIAKASQAINFGALPGKTFGDPDFTVSATGGASGNPVAFSASGNCTISGNTVHITGAGSCTVTASQAGDGNYNAAASVDRSFTIAKADQTITFGALADKTFGDAPFSVSATGGASGNPVTFGAAGNCTSGGANGGTITITGGGSCTVTASQAGGSNYNAATDVAQSFAIAKAASATALASSANPSSLGQSVTFTATVTTTVAVPTGTVQFKADGNDLGGAVTCVAGAGDTCTAQVSTTSLTAGAHTITADYSGDSNFNASSAALSGGQAVGAVFEFSQDLYTVAERAGSVTITVRRTGDTSGAASVDYATDDGSVPPVAVPCSSVTGLALERCDYTRAAGTLNWAAGDASDKTFNVLVNDDSYAEGTETLSLKLSNPGGGSTLGPQSSATLQITDDAPESAGNPVDDDQDFVRQHYHDFLNREPDAAGLQFWTSGITSCGADSQCRAVKRVNASAAFFLSIEFQQTGFFTYRLREAAFGDLAGAPVPVRLDDFLLDTQSIGRGVVVGQGNWQQQLEANKSAFALAFVQRPEFLARYPAATSAAAFVNSLNANAGGVLTDVERSALISELSPNPSDAALRAGVVRKVAENSSFAQAESNRAFVLMQYFGYLRRDPDSAPDTDFTGYDFWLAKLNQFNGDFVRAEMVKAFITSAEYRQRFGQP